MFAMYSLEAIERACGPTAARYARRKAIGGAGGQKGTRYEDILAIFKIAEAAKDAFSAGGGDFDPAWDVMIFSQLTCFVDDLVVRRGRRRFVVHYQAKNRQRTSWGTGINSLQSDFRRQLKLCTSIKLRCSLVLVVSDEQNSQQLSAGIPRHLLGSTCVLYLPYEKNVATLLRAVPAFRESFASLNPKTAPTDGDLLSTVTLLLGTWADTANRISVTEIFREMGTRVGPGGAPVIRPLASPKRLPRKLKAVLDGIPGFQYSLEKGFLQWSYATTDTGCYRYPCGSAGFEAFAKRQIQRQPKTYDDLEGELA